MHAPTGRLRTSAVLAVLLLLMWPVAGRSDAAEGARLRPRLFLSLFPPRVQASLWVLGGGWLAWPQADVPRTARQTPPFTLHLYNLATRATRTLHPPMLRPGQWVTGLAVAASWIAWEQTPSSYALGKWRLYVANLHTGQARLIDAARAEGDIGAVGNGEFTLSGDTLTWTRLHATAHGLRSLLKVEDLTTQHVQVVATADPARNSVLGWPTTDGRYVAWDRSGQEPEGTTLDTVSLFDLAAGRPVPLPLHGLTSEPALDAGHLAWKAGSRFDNLSAGRSAGIGLYDLRTHRLLTIDASGAGRPTLGMCVVAYGFTDNMNSAYIDGLYDYCHRRALNLTGRQETWPSGVQFVALQVAGQEGIMAADLHQEVGVADIALFHFSAAHPLYDFYH